MVTPGVVSFDGASGLVELDKNGDRAVYTAELGLENIVREGDDPGAWPVVVEVGHWRGQLLVLDEAQAIQWPDGSVYPEVDTVSLDTVHSCLRRPLGCLGGTG